MKQSVIRSMLGALVGDAAGATLEFMHTITESMVDNAMKMPGGGKLHIGPGQITDDGELTLTLWRALNVINGSAVPTATMISHYQTWYDSTPFDIGRTCSLAFEVFDEYIQHRIFKSIDECKKAVIECNEYSEANGALMRATAIPAWVVSNNAPIELAVETAKEDARLSHPSEVCQEVNAIYVFVITHLLKGIKPNEVLNLTNTFVDSQVKSDKVRQWYFEESLDINDMQCTAQIGHVRWGFVLAMYFLRNPHITFEEAIRTTLLKGGDTDTNAAIVGGLVAAYQDIPEYMLKPVLEFDCTKPSNRYPHRPSEYSVKAVLGKMYKL